MSSNYDVSNVMKIQQNIFLKLYQINKELAKNRLKEYLNDEMREYLNDVIEIKKK